MTQRTSQLPKHFRDLDPFVKEWGCLTTQDERYLRRQSLPMERLVACYEAVAPRLPAIFEHLDRHPFADPLPEPEELLRRLVLAMAEVAQAVEVYGEPGVTHAPERHSVPIRPLSRF